MLLALMTCAVRANAESAQTGPCEQAGAIGSIVDRPGLGRPTATNGSPCVVAPAHVLIEAGYRDQETAGTTRSGASRLEVYPLALVRAGLGARWEIVLDPPSYANRTGAQLGGVFVPAAGSEDSGFGFKRMLDDRAVFQDAAEIFYTAPTGSPQGTAGFSSGASTYTLSYTASVPVGSVLGASITQNFIANAAPNDPSGAASFFSYQPSITLSYPFGRGFTLLGTEQITTPASSSGGTGNRVLIAVQRVLAPAVVLDAEYEVNALPSPPSNRQHAFGIGGAFLL
jgi:hypothetical protein